MGTADIQRYPDNYEVLSTDAALRAEKIACELRHLIFSTGGIKKAEYHGLACEVHGIEILYEDEILEDAAQPASKAPEPQERGISAGPASLLSEPIRRAEHAAEIQGMRGLLFPYLQHGASCPACPRLRQYGAEADFRCAGLLSHGR